MFKPNNKNQKLYKLLIIGLAFTVIQHAQPLRAQDESVPPEAAIIPSKEIKATKRWRIAFFPKNDRFAFSLKKEVLTTWELAWNSMKQAALEYGVEVRSVCPEKACKSDFDCVEPQIRLIADSIKQGNVDGMIVVPFDSNRLAPIVEKAISAGIPVTGFDTFINSDKVTFVSINNFEASKAMGQWAVKKMGGRGNVVILEGDPLNEHSVIRRNGFLAGLATGHIKVLGMKTARWQEIEAKEIVAGWLKKYSNIDMIIAASDGMALGAANAVAEANRSDISITGFDGWPIMFKAIRSGKIAATINQDIESQARFALQLLVRHLERGETFPSVVYLPKLELISKDNIGDYLD
ncbi:MAG: sugar ABC transporter substrate-binding protein [Desulfobacteraceae bacterium]|jgi:ABC-type sugar transport system substrate-binding protein